MMKTFLLSIGALLLLLASSTLVSAFSTYYHQPTRHCGVGCTGRITQPEILVTRFATEDGGADDISSIDNESNTEEDSPKINVKCPDCDLCDGSGR